MTPLTADGDRLSVLLVEDNPGDARLFEEHLSQSGLDAPHRWAKTLEAGLEALREERPEVVVADLNLPDSTGLSTVRRIREEAPDLPVVVLTGQAGEEPIRAALEAGASEYLPKEGLTPMLLARTLLLATARGRLEREVRRRGERFEALVSNLSDVITVVAPDGRVLYESASVKRVLGYEPPELEGENILDYFHPADRDDVRQALEDVAGVPGRERLGQGRFRHADGSWRVVEARGRMPPEGADLDGIIVVSRDVTERVARERELERTTASLRERVKEQACLYDVSQILHADHRTVAECGQELVDRIPEGWQYPEVTTVRLQLGDDAWTTGGFSATHDRLEAFVDVDDERIGRVEVGYREERPAADIGPFISEEQELLDAIAGQIAVALERQSAREELDAERARLEEIFENASAFFAVARGADHVFEMVNPAYRELVGNRELIGLSVREALPELEGEGYFELLDHVVETGETVERTEWPLDLPSDEDGAFERRYVNFVYQPRREGDEIVGVIAHGIDVTEQVERRQEAEDREEKLGKILNTSADGILLTDRDGHFTYANPAAESMLGLEEAEISARSYRDPKWGITDTEGEPFPDEQLPVARVLRTGEPVRGVEHGVQRADGSRRILSVNAGPLHGADGTLQGVVASLRDVTEQRRQEKALRESEARYRTLVETMAEATLIFDADGRISFANAAAEELLGLETSELSDRTYNDPKWRITTAEGAPLSDQELPFQRVMESGRTVRNAEHVVERPDGERRTLAVNAAPLGNDALAPTGVVATIRDITERKKMEKELRHRALHDALTGLANRSLFRDRLKQAIASGKRAEEPVGLLMLDLDRFKQVNDHLGHTAGDRLLEEVARRLAQAIRGEDTVARLGGDEFAVIVPSVSGADGLRQVADRLLDSVTRPFTVGGDQVEIDVTIGGVLTCSCDETLSVPAGDPDDAVRYADLALFQAKETVGSSYHLFHPEQDRARTHQLGREQELRRAIREQEFEVHFQPIVRLEDGTVWGVEPLARWRHPERGLLSPAEFIPLAEETGLIHELGRLLFRDTCVAVAGWPAGTAADLNVTPNVSGRQFDSDGLVPALVSIAENAGVPPSRFELEITESAITRATGTVERLRSHGFGAFVDDFGTGYSSFHYLRDLELDGLKIDMSFVHGLAGGGKGRGLVETMVTLGRTMDMMVVAEGIESEEQRRVLLDLGCPLGQGFLFSRPMPAAELAESVFDS